MYLPPTKVADQLHSEIKVLENSAAALREAIKLATKACADTDAELGRLRTRLGAKTRDALPGDDGIRARLDAALNAAFADARRALTAHWDEVIALLEKAYARITGELTETKGKHRRALHEVEQQRQREGERLAAG